MQQTPHILTDAAAIEGARLGAAEFFALEKKIIESGLGSDLVEFAEIKRRLASPPVLDAEDFAREVIYVILAGGFSQKTAKKLWAKIVEALPKGEDITLIFKNANKTRAIARVWSERARFRDEFYALRADDAEGKIAYLATLPHVGKITAHHLARNLGISVVKYDVWIQRLGAARAGLPAEAVGFPLKDEVKAACDEMFAELERATGFKRGYIDVVLWKACQIKLITF